MKRSGGKFTGSSYGNCEQARSPVVPHPRGRLYYYKQSSEMKESTHHAGKVALEGTQVLAGGDGHPPSSLARASRRWSPTTSVAPRVDGRAARRRRRVGPRRRRGGVGADGGARRRRVERLRRREREVDAGGDGDVDSLVPALEKKLSLITAGLPCPNCGDARALVVNQQSGMWECNRRLDRQDHRASAAEPAAPAQPHLAMTAAAAYLAAGPRRLR